MVKIYTQKNEKKKQINDDNRQKKTRKIRWPTKSTKNGKKMRKTNK